MLSSYLELLEFSEWSSSDSGGKIRTSAYYKTIIEMEGSVLLLEI